MVRAGVQVRAVVRVVRPLDRTNYSVQRAIPTRAPLESVSLCTRFSGFSTISSFGFNRLSSKLVGMFFGIVPMFVLKDFARDCFVAQICAKLCVRAGIRAYLRNKAIWNKIFEHKHWNYPK